MGFWWFGRKSAPADTRPFVPAWLNTAEAEEGFARSYDAQCCEVYQRNPVGQRAVRLVAGMLGSLTIDAIEGDVQAAKLVRADGLLESIAANLLLHGNAYVQLLADDRDRPLELCQLRPERVSVCISRHWRLLHRRCQPNRRVGGKAAEPRCIFLGRMAIYRADRGHDCLCSRVVGVGGLSHRRLGAGHIARLKRHHRRSTGNRCA